MGHSVPYCTGLAEKQQAGKSEKLLVRADGGLLSDETAVSHKSKELIEKRKRSEAMAPEVALQ
jgi:hypothetical protein